MISRWKHEGVEAWTGQFIGEAVPELGLVAQARTVGTLPGAGRWSLGAVVRIHIRTRTVGQVARRAQGVVILQLERVQQQLPPPPPAIQVILGIDTNQKKSERLGPTFDYEAQLRTTSFKSATLVFHELDGADEVYSCGGGGSGSDPYGGIILGPFIEAQPLETNWKMISILSTSASPVDLNEAGSYPVIARRVWLNGRPPDPPSPQREEFLQWKGEVVLTHTPIGGTFWAMRGRSMTSKAIVHRRRVGSRAPGADGGGDGDHDR